MAIRKPAKANYKIFDKKKQKYVAGNRKSTWSSPVWVLQAAESYCNTSYNKAGFSDIEFHIFPIESAVIMTYEELRISQKAKIEEKKDAKLKAENAQRKNGLIRAFNFKQAEMHDLVKKMIAEGIEVPLKNTDPL